MEIPLNEEVAPLLYSLLLMYRRSNPNGGLSEQDEVSIANVLLSFLVYHS